jgi:hypothetical protein
MLIFANVAELSAERMEELAGQASLRDAGTTAGIATDKLLALSGDPALTIQHKLTLRPFNAVDLVAEFNKLHKAIVQRAKQVPDSVGKPPAAQLALPKP